MIFLRIGISVVILFLLNSLTEETYGLSYILASILVLMILTYPSFRHQNYIHMNTNATRIKSALAMILYAKISSITLHTVRSS